MKQIGFQGKKKWQEYVRINYLYSGFVGEAQLRY